jgi:hypothetical protein
MKTKSIARPRRPKAAAAKSRTASQRATARAKRGEVVPAKNPRDRSPKQENL